MKVVSRRCSVGGKSAFGFALCTLLLALCMSAQAQPPTEIARIGYFGGSRSAESARMDAFRQGLHELGYVEGKTVVIESRFIEGKVDRARSLAAELVGQQVRIIVTTGSGTTRGAKAATTTIPIVMTQDPDPVGNGFVASLAQPGGNITGLSNLGPELSGKRLELLKEVVPRLTRVAVFGTSTFSGSAQILKETELAANALNVELQYIDVLDPKHIETAFRKANKGRAQAVLVLAGIISLRSEERSQTSQSRAGSRRYTTRQSLSRTAA